MSIIELNNVTKEFKIAEKTKNFKQYLFNRKYQKIKAVQDISFKVKKGELLGFIGPNGAGKSTTIKMMTGILTTTYGKVKILGKDPFKNRRENAFKIGVVFGQRTQLWWELPAIDTFILHKEIYEISDIDFKENMNLFNRVLDINEFINRPSRQLSLGQRVRLDIALSFLHNPEIIFLDEPTIGLDLIVKKNIRKFIKKLSKERNITLVLTTHDMKDIEEVCDRLIMIDKGKKVLDMSVTDVKDIFKSKDILTVTFEEDLENLLLENMELKKEEKKHIVKYDKTVISSGEIISKLSQHGNIIDIEIRDTDIEDIIRDIYNGEIVI